MTDSPEVSVYGAEWVLLDTARHAVDLAIGALSHCLHCVHCCDILAGDRIIVDCDVGHSLNDDIRCTDYQEEK